jgi:hypothetical protein
MAGPVSIFSTIATEIARYGKAGKGHIRTEEMQMRTFVNIAAAATILAIAPAAFAQKPDHGTAEEAKAMLAKTVAALKVDKQKTIEMINKGEGGFLDRDLYPFCSNLTDGKVVAIGNPDAKQLIGVETRTLNDATGAKFGMDLYEAYLKPEGQITEVNYMFARPGFDKRPAPKVSFVTKVGDMGCGVGYYK